MPDYLNVPRFPLPDDWEVEETMCVTVRIPADPQYLAVLVGLIDMLKWSRNFARDATGTGAAIVSRTWQTALESQPIVTEACLNGVAFRVNEDCKLEYNCEDDPDVWRPVVTAPIDGEGGYDPRTDDQPPIPYPDPIPGQDPACLAAANATEWIKACADRMSELLDDDNPFAVLLQGMFLLVQIMVSTAIDIVTLRLRGVYDELDHNTIRADYLAFDWQEMTDFLVCYFEPDGTMTVDSWLTLINDLEAQTGQMWVVANFVAICAGNAGFTRAARYNNILEAECASCDGWEHIFEFTVGMDGCVFYEQCGNDIGLRTANGLEAALVNTEPCPTPFNGLIVLNTTPVHLTSAKVEGENDGVDGMRVALNIDLAGGTGRGVAGYLFASGITNGPYEAEEIDDRETNGFELYIDWAPPSGAQSGWIARLTLTGLGTNPYI